MSGKLPRTRQDLERQLEEQVGFLKRSADAYDQGFEDEAKRLAVALRILLHDTKNSKSLLGQLGMKALQFCDTRLDEVDTDNQLPYSGLRAILAGYGDRSGNRYVPLLDYSPVRRKVGFETWWNTVVIVMDDGYSFTRKGIVTTTANQDGGAHVDPALDAEYTKLSRDRSLKWSYPVGKKSAVFRGAEKATLRQITHEVLKTMDSSYKKDLVVPANYVLMASPVLKVAKEDEVQYKAGRNDPCPCGSGMKFKKCHGKPGQV